MYFSSKPGVLKLITIGLLIIVTGVGVSAHYSSIVKEYMDNPIFFEFCIKRIEDCPHETKALEIVFVWFNIACLGLSIINLAVCLFVEMKGPLKSLDIGFATLGGVIVLAGGAILIYCAVRIDESLNMAMPGVALVRSDFRKEAKYINKLVAGGFGILAAILFFSTAGAIRKDGQPTHQPQTIIIQEQVLQQSPQQSAYPQQVPNQRFGYSQSPSGYGVSGAYVGDEQQNKQPGYYYLPQQQLHGISDAGKETSIYSIPRVKSY